MPGDPIPVPLSALLAEARWLESLARALVADREEARDLVQDVWVAAAEHAPAHIERPRAWLATVLRNALRSRKRSAGPREKRERAGARSADAPGAADVVSRAEAQRTLVEHVLALDEPWRTTVLLRFFDGLTSEAIARREGVPASTARNRLAHALGLLRRRLERGGESHWIAAVVPLVGRPPEPVAGGQAIGTLFMGTGAKVALGSAVLAAVTWWSWNALEPRLGRDPESASSSTASIAGASGSKELADARRERIEPHARELAPETSGPRSAPPGSAEEPLPPGWLEVLVLDDGIPCTRPGALEVAPDWVPWAESSAPPEDLRRRVLSSAERIVVTGLAPGSHGLRLELAGGVSTAAVIDVWDDEGVRRELQIGSAALEGNVWDEEGEPLAGATILATWAPW